MRTSLSALALITIATTLVAGCGSAATTAHPNAPVASNAGDHSESAPTAKDAAAETPTVTPKEAAPAVAPPPSENDGIRKASRPPHDLIMAPDVLFVFNFAQSEVGESAKQRCEESAGDDRAALRSCLEAARAKVPVESIQFTKDAHGAWWWVTYNRYKGNLLKWNKVQFAPGEETTDQITLKLSGKDKGIAPMPRVPKTLAIDLPNDYSIVVKHPEFGAMTYDAKIGMLAPDPDR
ncbi:MAG TPA: hypothetical protein VFQ61_24060 [Polyangiaceae bacterium]|nr:hypothetical protein [Polyangiaceae bacterium]